MRHLRNCAAATPRVDVDGSPWRYSGLAPYSLGRDGRLHKLARRSRNGAARAARRVCLTRIPPIRTQSSYHTIPYPYPVGGSTLYCTWDHYCWGHNVILFLGLLLLGAERQSEPSAACTQPFVWCACFGIVGSRQHTLLHFVWP